MLKRITKNQMSTYNLFQKSASAADINSAGDPMHCKKNRIILL